MAALATPRRMHPRMIHEIIPVGWLKCNCSILGDPVTREALVLDPGDDVERILKALARHSLTVKAIVSTHAHIDHVGGLRKLQQATGAPVMMHGDDLDLYRHLDMQAAWLGVAAPDVANVDRLLAESDTVRWGPFAANVLHTPGHTPGSISLYLANLADVSSISGVSGESGKPGAIPATPEIDAQAPAGSGPEVSASLAENSATPASILFAGDTLFAGSIGRTDLWGGSAKDILRSIHQKLMALPEGTVVFPGHGAVTTIGEERATNPFLR
jgi:glyoxylase-like metal-dependent hydrolase (beta-lactamase superfamily II)